VLSGKEKGNHYTITPEFISDPKICKNFPLSQLLVYGFARTDSPANTMLHSKKGLTQRVAVIGHACDMRGLVEIHKKVQVKWENLFLIGFEDVGYIDVGKMMKFLKKENIDPNSLVNERLTADSLLLYLKDGSMKKYPLGTDIDITTNCSRCIQKSHPMVDVTVSIYGLNEDSKEFILTPQSDQAKKIIGQLQWSKKMISSQTNDQYQKDADQILMKCQDRREQELDAWDTRQDKLSQFSKCTACGMCVRACPVCFCVDCKLLSQVKAKKMDKMTFILTRFTHVGDTCVECGRCDANCPMNIPLAAVFQSLRRKFKINKKYEAGSKLDAKILHLDA
jgi:formate dehydrogenase subunit beta